MMKSWLSVFLLGFFVPAAVMAQVETPIFEIGIKDNTFTRVLSRSRGGSASFIESAKASPKRIGRPIKLARLTLRLRVAPCSTIGRAQNPDRRHSPSDKL